MGSHYLFFMERFDHSKVFKKRVSKLSDKKLQKLITETFIESDYWLALLQKEWKAMNERKGSVEDFSRHVQCFNFAHRMFRQNIPIIKILQTEDEARISD
jgi:hypothetical protein